MEVRPKEPGTGPGRGLRILAFLLSLVSPGAGHFLVGYVRRGFMWAIGLAAIGLAVIFTLPIALILWMFAASAILIPLGRLACALDTLWLSGTRPPWSILLVSWAALLIGGGVVGPQLAEYYRNHYAQSFTIPSEGMEPTLLVGDYIVTDKSVYRIKTPQRGDIVVFKYPLDEKRDFIKRVIGTPGDVVQVRGRQVFVNGEQLNEPYVKDGTALLQPGDQSCAYRYGCEPTRVPPNSFFVMGDNRENSQDSRYWGFVRRDRIFARAFTIYWSWDGRQHWARFNRVGRTL
jgi:signal peptidase I